MTGYEIIIAIVQIGTLIALFLALRLSRDEYRARTRPYIGFDEIKLKDISQADIMEFDVNVRNVGQLPARNAKLYGEFTVDGEEVTSFECETKGSIFPSPEPAPMWIAGIKEVDRDAIVNGTKNLRLTMTIDYYGIAKEKYYTYSTRIYDASRKGWVNEEGSWQ